MYLLKETRVDYLGLNTEYPLQLADDQFSRKSLKIPSSVRTYSISPHGIYIMPWGLCSPRCRSVDRRLQLYSKMSMAQLNNANLSIILSEHEPNAKAGTEPRKIIACIIPVIILAIDISLFRFTGVDQAVMVVVGLW